jgi:hypothetical protein
MEDLIRDEAAKFYHSSHLSSVYVLDYKPTGRHFHLARYFAKMCHYSYRVLLIHSSRTPL